MAFPVRHGCGGVMAWGALLLQSLGDLFAVIDGATSSALYQKILKENVLSSVLSEVQA